ncbi:MAG: hypothetical protein ABIB11_05045 [Candidatus Omnitrophota bacterium]
MAEVICDKCGKQRNDLVCSDCHNGIEDKLSDLEIELSDLETEHSALQRHCEQSEDEIQKLKGGSDEK